MQKITFLKIFAKTLKNGMYEKSTFLILFLFEITLQNIILICESFTLLIGSRGLPGSPGRLGRRGDPGEGGINSKGTKGKMLKNFKNDFFSCICNDINRY